MASLFKVRNLLATFATIVATFAVNPTLAQTFPLQVQVSVMPPYSAYLQDYPGVGQQVRVFIINTSRTSYQVRLTGQLTGDNGIEIRTAPSYRPPRPVTIPPGQTLLTRTDLEGLFDLNQVEVTGIDKNRLARGFPLPDGTYQLCVRAYNESPTNTATTAFGQPLSSEFPLGCSAPIVVRSVEPPILISPLCDNEVTATVPQAVVFTWTPPVGVSPASVDYTLRIVELPQLDVDPNVFIDQVVLPKSGLELRNLRTSTFLYGPTAPPLTVGKRYAWRVQAVDRSGKLNFLNDGKSPVCSFTYGSGPVLIANKPGIEVAQTPVFPIPGLGGKQTDTTKVAQKTLYEQKIVNCLQCKSELSSTEGSVADNQSALTKKQLTIAGFTVALSPDVSINGSQFLQGTGTVPIPYAGGGYLKVRVRLYDIQCNADGQAIAGYVRGLNNPDPKLLPGYDSPDFSGLSLGPAAIGNISAALTGLKDKVIQSLADSKNSIGWEMPLGVYTSKVDVAITNITFQPRQAFFDANLWLKVPSAQFGGVPLSAANVCLSPDKPICGDMTLFLGADMPLSSLVSLKGAVADMKDKPSGNLDYQKITSIDLTNWEFKNMHIVAGLKPPGLHRADTDQALELALTYDSPNTDFSDWTAEVNFPDFYVTGLKSFTFSMPTGKPGFYDHSETATPGVLPTGYLPDNEANQWKGLFFPEIQLKLGGFFSKMAPKGTALTQGVKNMIVDENGFSGQAYMANLLGLGDGNLASWYASIDTVALDFLKSKFKSAHMNGQVVLPIFKYKDNMDQSAVWPWTCALSMDDNGGESTYQFLITPKQDAAVDVWKAQLSLNKDLTHIMVSNKGGNFVAEAVLDGKVSINTGTFLAPGVTFKGLTLTSADPYVKLDGFTTSFASPQKELAGMPLTLTKVGLTKAAPSSGQQPSALSGQFDFGFTGGIELAEAASLTATATARVRFSAGLDKGRPNWKYVDLLVDHISGDGHIGVVTTKVELDFYHDDAKYGNGFGGSASLGLGFVGGLAVKARFGRTLAEKGNFRYWYAGGDVVIPAGGIPIGTTPVAFKGFGGGAFSRMTQVTNKKGEIDYEPSSSTKFGVNATVTVGTVGSNLLNMKGGLTMAFDDNFAPTLVNIHADAYLLAKDPPTFESPLAKGTLDVNFDIAHSIFDAKGSLQASYGVSGFKVEAVAREVGLHIKPNEGKWFFSLGVPNERLNLDLYIASEKPIFTFGSYLLTGNDIPSNIGNIPPDPYKLSAKTKQDLHYVAQDIKPLIASNTPMLAFGAGYHTEQNYNIGPFFLDFKGDLGYDLAMYNTDQACGGTLPGINGWYATGQIYAYLYFALGINVDLWVYSGKITAVEVEAGALLQGGLVNPVWFHGNVFLKYNVLHGAVKGKMNMDFWYNKDGQCKPAYTPPNPFADQPIIAKIGPSTSGNDQVSILTPMYAEFNYPINSQMEIDATMPDGKTLHRSFRIQFKSGQSFESGLVLKSGPGGFEKCANDMTGRIKYGQVGTEDEGETYTATFFRSSAMAPNSQYDLNLGAEVWHEYTADDNDSEFKSGWHPYRYKGTFVEQSTKTSFKTGACLTGLTKEGGDNATVMFSYPFEGQRYFMRKDGGKFGVVMLTAKMCCMNNLSSDAYFSLQVRMTPYVNNGFKATKAGGALYADAKFVDDNRAQYVLPEGLKASTLYALDLVRVPTQKYIDEQLALEKQAKQKAITAVSLTNKFVEQGTFKPNANEYSGVAKGVMPGAGMGSYGQSVNEKAASLSEEDYLKQLKTTGTRTINYKENMKDIKQFDVTYKQMDDPEALSQKYEQILYSYYFKTSQYERMADKLQAVTMVPDKQVIYPVIRNGANRDNAYAVAFTSAEHFDTFELEPQPVPNGSITIQPMVNFKDISYNDWVKDFANNIFSGFFPLGTPSSPNPINTFSTAQQYLLQYDRPDFSAPDPPLSKNTIDLLLVLPAMNFLSTNK